MTGKRKKVIRRSPRINRLIRDLPGPVRGYWDAFEATVHPPRDLMEFHCVAQRLPKIVACLPGDADPGVIQQAINFGTAVETLASRAAAAGVRFPENESRSRRLDRHPFRTYLSHHPVYCQLGFPSTVQLDRAADQGHARLQALLLVLILELADHRPDQQFLSAIRRCCEAIRELQADPVHARFLHAVAGWDNTLATYDTRLRRQLKRESYLDSFKAQDAFRLLLDYLLYDKTLRQGGGSRRRHVKTPGPVDMDVDPDDASSSPPSTHVTPGPVSRTQGTRARRLGASPGDIANTPVAARPNTRINSKRGESAGQYLRSYRRQRRAMATRNQRTPLALERIHVPQMAALFAELARLHNPDRDSPGRLDHQLRTALELVFWTGSTVDEVLSAQVVASTRDLPDNPHHWQRFLVPPDGWWMVPAPELDHQASAHPTWAGEMRPALGYLALPLPERVRELLSTLVPRIRPGQARLLFSDAARHDTLRERATERVKACNRDHSAGGLTPHRLALHRLFALYDRTGDLAEAALITGRTRSVGYDSPLYYHAPYLRELADLYRDSCLHDLRRLDFKPAPGPSTTALASIPGHATAGVQVCPRAESVLALVTGLADRVATNRTGVDADLERLVHWHNHLTVYVTAMVLWATGHRVVGGPLYDKAQVAGEFLVIDDKRGAYGGEPRAVWLPPLVREQLEVYEAHARALLARLLLTAPAEFRSRHPRRHPGWTAAEPEAAHLFYLRGTSRTLHTDVVTARDYGDHLGALVQWPANAHRHYLRTHLREAGVNGEVVDAFMGHGQIGCEPLGRFSTLAPPDVAAATGPHVERLLDQAGWQVLPGLGGA